MADKRDFQDTGNDLTRASALSDGVIAIAMTLLVFNLKVPELEFGDAPQKLPQQIADQIPSFISFFISFFVIAIFWVSHHRLMKGIVAYDRKLLWRNLYFLMGVSLIPFSAALQGRYPNSILSNTIYFGNLAMVSIMLNVLWRYAVRKDLVDPDMSPESRRYLAVRALVPAVMFLLAIPVAYFEWRFALLPPLLIPLVMKVVQRRFGVTS